MTGAELRAALEAMTDEQLARPVVIEGCDCCGWATNVEYDGTVDHYPNATSEDIPERRPHIWIGRSGHG